MTEEEAANKLCVLLNEIEGAGHEVVWTSQSGVEGLQVGDGPFVAEPPSQDEPWEVRL